MIDASSPAVNIPAQTDTTKQRGVFRDLFNREVELEYGPGSYVDPEVVVDAPGKISIGANTIIRKGVVLRTDDGEIHIGNNCEINHYSVLHANGGIYIGDWCVIAPHCAFYAHNYTFDRFDTPITKQYVGGKGIYLMGDNLIGSHSVVCDNVTLGKGAVIGANSTVTRSVSFAAVAAGSPARIIRTRYGDHYDFQERERATEHGMPEDIMRYVQGRAELLTRFVSPDDSVLDLGCGEGMMTRKIAEKCNNITGCDYSSSVMEVAAKKFPQIKFIQANVTSIPFENDRFSRVIFTEVAEHLLPIQLKKALQEIVRVLHPDGALLLTTPITGSAWNTSSYAHIYEYSPQQITSLLKEHFDVVQMVNSTFGLFTASGKKSINP
ncbi:MAG: methyltransferase domain-containing protein [Chitinispirillaceae bacterium]|nr:methyltransferase domain-containing protein [Chitinispirillaceae bacterium]